MRLHDGIAVPWTLKRSLLLLSDLVPVGSSDCPSTSQCILDGIKGLDRQHGISRSNSHGKLHGYLGRAVESLNSGRKTQGKQLVHSETS